MSTYDNISQETLLTVPLTDIVAPSLNDVNYASALNNVFENINNNFKTLANHEFVKGDKGKSVEIVPTAFFYNDYIIDKTAVDSNFAKMNLPNDYRRFFDGTENYYGELLKKTILSLSNNEKDYDDANGYSIFSNFTKDNAGRIQMLVNTDDINDESAPASSLYYVFLDGRYANKNLGNAEESQYTNIKDFSCILVYNSKMHDSNGEYLKDENDNFVDGFEVLSNAFPTIYYEKNVGLCWKLNGIGTGIPVKGAMGKNGKDANIVIVRANAVNESNEIGSGVQTEVTEEYKRPLLNVVTGVYENYFGYNSISDYSESALEELSDCTALILTNHTQDYLVDENGNFVTDAGKNEKGEWKEGNYILNPNSNKFYFGRLSYETDKGDPAKKKLYAYCNPGTSINSAITTENIINIFKNINIKNESVDASSGLKGLFIPIENTGSDKQKAHLLTATAITDGFETIKSDFLFTPVNDINTVSPNATNEFKVDKYLYIKVPKSHPIFRSKNTDFINNFKSFNNGASNYCLKYKLTSFIQQKSHLTFDETSEYSKNSMYFGYGIDPKNVKYYTFYEDGDENATGGLYKYVDKSIDSMPFSFRSLLSDSTELSDAKGIYKWELCYDTNEFDIDELRIGDVNYDLVFPDCFKSIFTTDLTPSKSSEIMWFDGVSTVGELSGKTVINGWIKNSGFEFIKFTPIYNIDKSKISTDTALNLNYNVNIAGDEADYSRDLNVTGNIHCNDINIHGDIYIDKINKVYTENDIITTKDLHSRNFDVENGRVSCDSINASRNINTANISASADMNASNVKSNIINASEQLYVGNNSITIGENSNTVELNNISNLHIGSYAVMQDDPNDTARIDSSLSTLNKNNSSITLFNGSVMDESVFMKGVPRDCEFNEAKQYGGEGISANSNVFNATFEAAKNFNIHRLSFQSDAKIEDSTTTNTVTKEYNISNFIKSDASDRAALLLKEKTTAREKSITLKLEENELNNYFIDLTLNTADFKKSNNTYVIPDKLNILIDKEFMCELSHKSMIDNLSWINPFSSNSYLKIYGFILVNRNYDNIDSAQEYYKVYDKELPIIRRNSDAGYDFSVGHDVNNVMNYSAGLEIDRYYQCVFNIGSVTIELNENIRNNIAKILNSNSQSTVELRFYIGGSFTSDRVEYNQYGIATVSSISLYNARPMGTNISGGNLVYAIALESWSFIKSNIKPLQESVGKLSYDIVTTTGSITETITESNIKTTTLCNDGIVTRAGKYVFGLGFAENMVNHRVNGYSPVSVDDPHWKMSKTDDTAYNQRVPIIFYHKYSPKYYGATGPAGAVIPKNNLLSSQGYARRTNAISLEELFNVVGFVQSTYLQYGV